MNSRVQLLIIYFLNVSSHVNYVFDVHIYCILFFIYYSNPPGGGK